jgi:hypothetical protein
MSTETVKLNLLRELVGARSVDKALVVGQRGGWAVRVRYGTTERALAAKSGATRVFKTVDGAVRVLRQLGLGHVELDATKYRPGAPRKRPDTSKAMRDLHAHDRWFRDQVQLGIDDLAAGRIVSETKHKKAWAKKRAALVRVADGR